MDICSLKAYEEIVSNGTLGRLQESVMKVFLDRYPEELTATDVVRTLGRGVSENIRNRVTELHKNGFLKNAGKTYCSYAESKGKKRLVNKYVWSGRIKPYRKEITTYTCPICNGIGSITKEVFVKEVTE